MSATNYENTSRVREVWQVIRVEKDTETVVFTFDDSSAHETARAYCLESRYHATHNGERELGITYRYQKRAD